MGLADETGGRAILPVGSSRCDGWPFVVALAQWQSSGLWNRRLRVRAPQATPNSPSHRSPIRVGCWPGLDRRRKIEGLPDPPTSGQSSPSDGPERDLEEVTHERVPC